jgi:2-succinyl-6-hydroxy-2,4-cyclohexadiene-1-carboxylate synthase
MRLNLEKISKNETGKKIFFLHGFTGSGNDWRNVIEKLPPAFTGYAIDLLGHGKSPSPDDVNYYTAEALVEHIDETVSSITTDKFILVGYSMGGRAALCYAVKNSAKLAGLVLESSTAGIPEEKERVVRKLDDEKLAEFIDQKPIESFVDYWMNIDIFGTLRRFSNERLAQIRKEKMLNNKIGLANTLRGFSTGRMPVLFNEIIKIKCPSLLLTGQLDSKFNSINSEMIKYFKKGKHVVIKNSGHNIHLEELASYIKTLNDFLLKLR